jgi:hypothetical protein
LGFTRGGMRQNPADSLCETTLRGIDLSTRPRRKRMKGPQRMEIGLTDARSPREETSAHSLGVASR